jgi:hypothetical protein
MDMFGSSDEEDNTSSQKNESLEDQCSEALCNSVFTLLMKMKPKIPVVAAHNPSIVLESEVVVVSKEPARGQGVFSPAEHINGLMAKLGVGKVRKVEAMEYQKFVATANRRFDVIVCLFELTSLHDVQRVESKLISNGTLLTFGPQNVVNHFPSDLWATENAKLHAPVLLSNPNLSTTTNVVLIEVRKRPARINQSGALYWPGLRTGQHIAQERANVEAICVCLTAQEVASGFFSVTSHERAVRVIQEYGVCILPQIYDAGEVRAWGEAGRADMNLAIQRLRVQYNVDLLANAEDVSMDNIVKDNFHELSMREAYRCDLRNSPKMTQMHAHLPVQLNAVGRASMEPPSKDSTAGGAVTAGPGAVAGAYVKMDTAAAVSESADPTAPLSISARVTAAYERCLASRTVPSSSALNSTSATQSPELRYHRGLVGALTEIMNPLPSAQNRSNHPDEVNIEHGNWGKWNFSGPGPGSFNHPCIGKMGVVVSLPGCKDQTIHADTAHVYEHVHLPPHYLNFFLPCADNEAISTAALKQPIPAVVSNQDAKTAAAAAAAAGTANGMELEEEEVFIDEEATLREALANAERDGAPTECFFQGQTAFVVGSHKMGVAATAMTHPEAQSFLESRLVRPQLSAGDGLIFDCRILHFGLSNWSHLKKQPTNERDWRLMMYVNYHQQWFLDPKNWNDNKKLF